MLARLERALQLVDEAIGFFPTGRVGLRTRQDECQRTEVVRDRLATLNSGLQWSRATAAERVKDDIARPRVLLDELMRDLGGEHAVVRAHGVHRVAPAGADAMPEVARRGGT